MALSSSILHHKLLTRVTSRHSWFSGLPLHVLAQRYHWSWLVCIQACRPAIRIPLCQCSQYRIAWGLVLSFHTSHHFCLSFSHSFLLLCSSWVSGVPPFSDLSDIRTPNQQEALFADAHGAEIRRAACTLDLCLHLLPGLLCCYGLLWVCVRISSHASWECMVPMTTITHTTACE